MERILGLVSISVEKPGLSRPEDLLTTVPQIRCFSSGLLSITATDLRSLEFLFHLGNRFKLSDLTSPVCVAECLVGRGPELICESECCEDDRERCKTSELDWGTILVTGELSMNTVSKQVFGGKKFLMIAVVDISDAAAIDGALPSDLTVVFHLAAVVSGETRGLVGRIQPALDCVCQDAHRSSTPAATAGHAEADLDAGMSVNLTGTLNVLQRCRSIATTTGRPPVLVFTSSVAVFGGELREPVDEMHVVSPQVILACPVARLQQYL